MRLLKLFILKLYALLFISGCSNLPLNNVAPGYYDTFKAINNAVFGYEDQEISPEVIENIPYASMLLKIGKGPKGLLILESKKNARLTWLSADGVYIVLIDGVIIQTSGLINNVSGHLDRSLPLDDILEHEVTDQTFYFSYDKPELRNLKIQVEYILGENEEVEILGKNKSLKLIREKGIAKSIGWKFENRYWVDEDLNVLKSEQHISPRLPKITYIVTKKPS